MAEEGKGWRPIKWSALASGEGGGKIAALYFCTKRNEAIGDRVLLINTAKADLERTIKEVHERLGDKGEPAKSQLESIRREKMEQFGPPAGAGNFWKEGENAAREDFEKEELIRRRVETLHLGMGDAIFEITTLGGGTGCGSIPFIIDKMKGGGMGPLAENKHFAVAVWPEMTEGGQRHFNAICGLSRLFKFGKDAHQNADMVILVDNSLLAERIPKARELSEDKYFEMNKHIVEALGLMVAPGRGRSDVVIDVNDYVNFPSAIGVYHAAPCLSLGNDIELIGLEAALDDALDNPFFPMDPNTATMVWLVVRVPQKYYKRGEFEHDTLDKLFSKWVQCHIVGEVRYSAITYEEDATMNTFDVLLLLGGFKLDKLVPESYERYQKFRKVLESSATGDNIILHGKANKISLSVSELDLIENNLKSYMGHTEKVFERLS
jgi:cell division GTPase FtsZ